MTALQDLIGITHRARSLHDINNVDTQRITSSRTDIVQLSDLPDSAASEEWWVIHAIKYGMLPLMSDTDKKKFGSNVTDILGTFRKLNGGVSSWDADDFKWTVLLPFTLLDNVREKFPTVTVKNTDSFVHLSASMSRSFGLSTIASDILRADPVRGTDIHVYSTHVKNSWVRQCREPDKEFVKMMGTLYKKVNGMLLSSQPMMLPPYGSGTHQVNYRVLEQLVSDYTTTNLFDDRSGSKILASNKLVGRLRDLGAAINLAGFKSCIKNILEQEGAQYLDAGYRSQSLTVRAYRNTIRKPVPIDPLCYFDTHEVYKLNETLTDVNSKLKAMYKNNLSIHNLNTI